MASKKGRSYWRKVFSETWKETELREVITGECTGGVMIVVLAIILGIAKMDELIELAFLAVGGGTLAVASSFIFRFLFIVPPKLHNDQEKKLKGLESKPIDAGQAEHLPITSFHWSQILTAMLVCIPTSLVLLLAVQLSKNAKSKSESPPTSTVKAAVSKPLPDKIIPKPELSPAVSTPPPIATVEPQKVFETESQDTNSVEAALAQLKDEKQLRIRNMEDMALASWTNNLATYRYALKSLYDIMKSEATRRNDSITLTTDYLNSLPPTIDHSNKEIEVAVIKFTNQTNMDFHIVITGEFRSGEYIMQKRGLRISCGCGNLRFESMGPGNLSLSLQIPDGDSPSPWNVDHELISKKLKILVAAQIEYLKTKSH